MKLLDRSNALISLRHCLLALAVVGCAKEKEKSFEPALTPATPVAEAIGRGTVRGRIRVIGATSLPPISIPASAQRVCGPTISDRSLRVGPTGGLAHAAVSIDAPAEKPVEPSVLKLDQRRCEFLPPLLVGRVGDLLEARNSDPTLHNVRARLGEAALFNFAMPIENTTQRKPLGSNPGPVRILCDVHPWMQAQVVLFEHPYFSASDESGSFEIRGVPAGRQRLRFHHPRHPGLTRELEVLAGQTSVLDVELAAADFRR